MHASEEIRGALARVAELRQMANGESALARSVQTIKQLQAQRFAATYADFLADPVFAPSAQFFLEELYSVQDYSARDAQFARVAGAIERSFPDAVVAIVLTLAKLHRQTEELDLAMAKHWPIEIGATPAQQYLGVWRKVGQRPIRYWQLESVLAIGQTLGRLTRKPGLRMMLKVMRRPAELAGLGSLQSFLESGFDHFSSMARQPAAVDRFLNTIRSRETTWIDKLFDAHPGQCEAELLPMLQSVSWQPSLDKGQTAPTSHHA